MTWELIIPAFATLFVVVDPIGLSPLFAALTQGFSAAERRKIALRATLVAAIILTLFAAFGQAVLEFTGISLPAFRIAGGALLFLTALDMLFERRQSRREGQADNETGPDPSVFPLAVPLIAGPGAIAAVILLSSSTIGWGGFGIAMIVLGAVLALTLLLFLAAGNLDRVLGKTGIDVVTRVLGMLLAALAVQFILDGLSDFGFGPGTQALLMPEFNATLSA